MSCPVYRRHGLVAGAVSDARRALRARAVRAGRFARGVFGGAADSVGLVVQRAGW
jgi:hypothetical protein